MGKPGNKRADKRRREAHSRQDKRLDEALVETFPASDPIAAGQPTGTEPPSRPADRQAPLTDADAFAAAARRQSRPTREAG
jgi:hypothetical protein